MLCLCSSANLSQTLCRLYCNSWLAESPGPYTVQEAEPCNKMCCYCKCSDMQIVIVSGAIFSNNHNPGHCTLHQVQDASRSLFHSLYVKEIVCMLKVHQMANLGMPAHPILHGLKFKLLHILHGMWGHQSGCQEGRKVTVIDTYGYIFSTLPCETKYSAYAG